MEQPVGELIGHRLFLRWVLCDVGPLKENNKIYKSFCLWDDVFFSATIFAFAWLSGPINIYNVCLLASEKSGEGCSSTSWCQLDRCPTKRQKNALFCWKAARSGQSLGLRWVLRSLTGALLILTGTEEEEEEEEEEKWAWLYCKMLVRRVTNDSTIIKADLFIVSPLCCSQAGWMICVCIIGVNCLCDVCILCLS